MATTIQASSPPPLRMLDQTKINQDNSAKNLQANLNAFYTNTFARDYKALNNAAMNNQDTKQAQASVAADLATLNNLQRELAGAAGDTKLYQYLKDNPNQLATTDNGKDSTLSSTNIMAQAGGDPNAKFAYTGLRNSTGKSDDGSQAVTATLLDPTTKQPTSTSATAAFQGGAATAAGNANNQSSNTDGTSNLNWTASQTSQNIDAKTGQVMSAQTTNMAGGFAFNSDSQKKANMDTVLKDPTKATANQLANAFAYFSTLPADQQKTYQSAALQPALNKVLDVGKQALPASNAAMSQGYENFNNIYNSFVQKGASTV